MDQIKRYAVYYAPRPGAFADAAAAWLGRDPADGAIKDHPRVPGITDVAQITVDARRYGFHGTLRAPFRPAPGVTEAEIDACLRGLAARLRPVVSSGLGLHDMNGFLALTPLDGGDALGAFGAAVVTATDPLRARLTAADIARRKPERLTPRQRALLERWGYPFVMEEFVFHLTLTGLLPVDRRGPVAEALLGYLDPVLPRPFVVEDLCLFAEDATGLFHLRHRYPLSG